MVYRPYSDAIAVFRRKLVLTHHSSGGVAVAELKVWRVPKSERYPQGIKYSMFLVDWKRGRVLVGFDNHSPKGHHLHVDGREVPYRYRGVRRLVGDFWDRVRRKGYEE
jgi:hypothetical protein